MSHSTTKVASNARLNGRRRHVSRAHADARPGPTSIRAEDRSNQIALPRLSPRLWIAPGATTMLGAMTLCHPSTGMGKLAKTAVAPLEETS